MDARTPAAQRAAANLLPGALRWLEAWLRIPSISGSAAHRADVQEAARLVGARLGRFAAVEMAAGRDGPVVIARVRGRDQQRPAVLVYGHLDVKPPGPGWHSDPFRPVRRGRHLIARGASDDKGQLLAHLVAAQAWAAVGGPPSDLIVVIESAEEIGSPGLAEVLSRIDEPVGAVLISDTRQAAPGTASLTLTQRGMIGLRVAVDAGGGPVHAGRYGGAVRDPSLVLAAALARAERLLAGLPRDRVVPVPGPTADDTIRRSARRAMHDSRLAELTTARAALSVTSFRSGGPPGAVPGAATARLDVRLPPSVPPRAVMSALRGELTRAARPPLTVAVTVEAACRGFVARHDDATLAAVRRACLDGFGKPGRLVGSGGSIPAVVALEDAFGCSPVLLGIGAVDDGAHGADEHLDLDALAKGVRASVALLDELARQSHPNGSRSQPANSARHRSIGLPGARSRGDAGTTSGISQRLGRRDG